MRNEDEIRERLDWVKNTIEYTDFEASPPKTRAMTEARTIEWVLQDPDAETEDERDESG